MIKIISDLEKKSRFNKLKKHLKHINKAEKKLINKPDEYFQERIIELIHYVKERNFSIDVILPEAFALTREATRRVLGIRQYDVQVLGGISLFYNHLTEMKTGEGKTYVTLFPAVLNAILGEHTHVVTANHYLAKRDFETLNKVLNFLGVTSSLVPEAKTYKEKKEAYSAAVSFGNIFDFIFDYLNNNLNKEKEGKISFKYDNIILDEADYTLIDEARRPVNITGNITSDIKLYHQFNDFSKDFEGATIKEDDKSDNYKNFDYLINPKNKTLELTEKGFEKLEHVLTENEIISKNSSIYISENLRFVNFLYNALKSNFVLKKDIDYIIDENNTVILVDENSGRPEKGSRWGDGLHQAVEAKENVEIKAEANVKATITIQNYLKLYNKLSGMTGTALNDEEEFKEIYSLNVCVIPTNKPNIRQDNNDLLFEKKEYVYEMALDDIKSKITKGRPVLIGTLDVAASEQLSEILKNNGINHNILNAKNHTQEANVIAQAGKSSMVTIATSMAGRGTDIILGGNKDIEIKRHLNQGLTIDEANTTWLEQHNRVVEAGGLHIIGIERNDSRRLDNQLIGRAGRQGDPGSTIFYLSLEDKLLKIFGEPIKMFWRSLNVGTSGVTHSIIDKTILNGQKKIEGSFFNQRKYLLRYDNINGEQRELIYQLRDQILNENNLDGLVTSYINFSSSLIIKELTFGQSFKDIDNSKLIEKLKTIFNFQEDFDEFIKKEKIDHNSELINSVDNYIFDNYNQKMSLVTDDIKLMLNKNLLLTTIDNLWEQHLSFLNSLRKNADLSVNAQEDPVTIYKKEALDYFKRLIEQIKIDYISSISHFNPIELLTRIEEEKAEKLRKYENDNYIKGLYPFGSNDKNQIPDMFLETIGV
jgi:preprotein translocase subunit SecA